MPGGYQRIERAIILLVFLLGSLPSVLFAASVPAVTILTPPVTKNVGTPLRFAFDTKGNFFVTDPRIGGVSKFDSDGQLVSVMKTNAPPHGIAFTDRGELLVSQGDSVVILDQEGAELGRLGSGFGQFKKANGIAVDAAGFVYVVDSLDNNVKLFTAAGQFVREIGAKGTGAGQFSMPTGIAYEKSANVIVVADTSNGRLQFFSASGNYDFIKSIGSFGTKPLQFRTPVGLAFEYDMAGGLSRMYVVDTYQNNVQVIDPTDNGKFLAYIGNNGFSNGQLMVPVDVVFDKENQRILVANGSGHITMYGIDGGTNPTRNTPPTFTVNPVPQHVGRSSITISGTVESHAGVVVTTNTAAMAAPVVYTSATTWKCSVSGLIAGINELTAVATFSNGAVIKHAIGIIYNP